MDLIYSKDMIKSQLLFVLLLLFSDCIFSQDFDIIQYNVDIEVSSEGYFDVSERILVDFKEQRRGIYRRIPIVNTFNDKKVKVRIDHIEVHDHNYKVYTDNGNKTIRIGKEDVFIEGEQEYWIDYRVTGAFLWLDSHTEFTWNIIGNSWDVPIQRVDYNVSFPTEFEIGEYDYEIFSGPVRQDLGKAMISERNNIIRGRTKEVLEPNEGVTLAVRLPVGSIQNTEQGYKLSNDYGGVIPLGLFGALLFWFRKFGRNRREKIEDEHYPPEEFYVSEAATFFDHSASPNDILAMIPEWGQKGYIRMKGFDEGDGKDYYIEQLEPLPEDVPEYQRLFYQGIFKSGPVVLLSDLKDTMFKTYVKVHRSLKRSIKRDRWIDLRSKRTFHSGWLLLGALASILLGVYALIANQMIFTFVLCLIIALTCIIIHFLPPKRSDEGLQLANRIKGLRQFMKKMPEEKVSQIVNDDPDYFERLFPYAIAFGLDKKFIKAFKSYDIPAPHWYYYGSSQHGYHPVKINQFSEQFNMNEVQSAFVTSPNSSGSSGSFSGGGSTGGGFGGGGGGSW